MTARLGRITARLAEPERSIAPRLIELINHNINPPTLVAASDVHIRAMYVVSDQVNSFGGRFPADEHERLADMLIDSPVLAGHRKDKLPLARTFHAETEEREGARWVKAYFYWLRNADGAESLRKNIDGGIYRECSVGFTFSFAECSICGEDIRLCDHEPLEVYQKDGTEQTCHFNYRRIERVLETSLVYRGATPGTSFSRELSSATGENSISQSRLTSVRSLSDLPEAPSYLVVPHYDSIHCEVGSVDGGSKCELVDCTPGDFASLSPVVDALKLPDGERRQARLVGYRGRERCDRASLDSFLKGEESPVRRLVLHVFPGVDDNRRCMAVDKPGSLVRTIPYRLVTRSSLITGAREIMTASGVEIWPVADGSSVGYHVSVDRLVEHAGDRYQLFQTRSRDQATLDIHHEASTIRFVIRQFHAGRLLKGARFIAETLDSKPDPTVQRTMTASGRVISCAADNDTLSLHLDGALSGTYRIRPVLIDGERRLLLYRYRPAGRSGGADVA